MPKKMERDSVCLLQAFKHGHKTRCLEPEAFRLNVGNLTTEYQYAAALRGFPLIKFAPDKELRHDLPAPMG